MHLIFNTMSFIVLVLLLWYYNNVHKKRRKNSNDLAYVLNKNMELLVHFERKHDIKQLKNSIQLYSLFQIVLKIANADYVSFFKYDYSKKFLPINFIVTVDKKGHAIQKSELDNIPASSNLLTLDIIRSDDKDLCYKYVEDIKSDCDDNIIYNAYNSKEISKLYYQNIFVDCDMPTGFIIFAYKNKDFVIPEYDKEDILNIIEKMKNYI